MLHHVELWVPDLRRATERWRWLLRALGDTPYQEWSDGRSWRSGRTYVVLEQSPALTADRHDRCRPGLNHLAFHVDGRARLDDKGDEIVGQSDSLCPRPPGARESRSPCSGSGLRGGGSPASPA
ncbi:hypothetical protein E1267_21270 [Nonomuraea longispora]|uniref:VOC domain-containing protein n=1 Tax=Nonomuraea longispora TaxID=1848320 RepID=A0A4R4NE04_9ACTN|nr:VOC family protein [Nonomuraea longispora]TDC04942.1 hypothetical protein E1267_21270 [Nonomuraea longispora]